MDGGKLITYRSSWYGPDRNLVRLFPAEYSIRLSSVQRDLDVSMMVSSIYETYTIEYYYDYDVNKKKVVFIAIYIGENGDFMRIKEDNLKPY